MASTFLILHDKKRGKDFQLFFLKFFRTRIILRCLYRKKQSFSVNRSLDKVMRETGDICKTLFCPNFYPFWYHRSFMLLICYMMIITLCVTQKNNYGNSFCNKNICVYQKALIQTCHTSFLTKNHLCEFTIPENKNANSDFVLKNRF